MNTLNVEQQLAERYKYKKLNTTLSRKYRQYFTDNIPSELRDYFGSVTTLNGTKIAKRYNRIVVGDYGAFIEIDDNDINKDVLILKEGQEYRFKSESYQNIKYIWYTVNDDSNIKIYYQLRTVSYANYVPKKFYISVHEIKRNYLP